MRPAAFVTGLFLFTLLAGCSRPVAVRNAHFRSVRLHVVGGECLADGLESRALPTKLANVKITVNSKGTYRVTGRYAEIGDEPLADAEILVVMPAPKGTCLYRHDGHLGNTNMKGQFDFKFLPSPRQEVFLYKPGYTPQMLKLPLKKRRK